MNSSETKVIHLSFYNPISNHSEQLEKYLYFRNSTLKKKKIVQLVYFTLFKVAYRIKAATSCPVLFTTTVAKCNAKSNENVSTVYL